MDGDEREERKRLELDERLIITGTLRLDTGLHIGKGREGMEIGGVDLPIVRDSLTNEPIVPGSSLKGTVRALLEREKGLKPTASKGKGVQIHECEDEESYERCPVCQIFGLPPEDRRWVTLPRAVFRDAHLTDESRETLKGIKTDLRFTEIKQEAAIDRITAAANPRQVERVPAGAEFHFEVMLTRYKGDNKEFLGELLRGLRHLQDRYLGGHGSRGYGKVSFRDISITRRPAGFYIDGAPEESVSVGSLDGFEEKIGTLLE